MHTRPSPGLLDDQDHRPRAESADRAARVRFRRAVTLMLMTLLLPGSAQLVAGNKRVGRIALRIWFLVLLLGLVSLVAVLLASPAGVLGGLEHAAAGPAAGAADGGRGRLGRPVHGRVADRPAAHPAAEPASRRGRAQRLPVAAPSPASLLFGAHLVAVQRDFMITMFGDGSASGAHDGRYNVLLLGGDSGAGRWGLRPDSMTVASIDARTGRTVLIGLPRNMANFPFRDGLGDGPAVPATASTARAATSTASAPGPVTTPSCSGSRRTPASTPPSWRSRASPACEINYWAMVNLEGFKDLVDAVGGVTLNVRDRIPVGGLGDRRHRLHRAGRRARSTGTTPCGSPGPGRARTTTPGWPGRSA